MLFVWANEIKIEQLIKKLNQLICKKVEGVVDYKK